MSIDSPLEDRKDTRGLPEGFDPHNFYEYRHATLVNEAKGIESFIYKYIPWKLLKSWTIALDPTAPFKVAPRRITPENRTRKRAVASVLQLRTFHVKEFNYSWTQSSNFMNVSGCASPNKPDYYHSLYEYTSPQGSQEPLVDEAIDTTSRTRLMGSEQGTMRLFKSYIDSPGRTVRTLGSNRNLYNFPSNASCSAVGGTTVIDQLGWEERVQTFAPTSATFSQSDLDTFKAMEYSYLDDLIAKNAVSMFKEWSPQKRDSTLFRNAVELRDIPKSIASLQSSLGDMRRLWSSLTSENLRKVVFDLKRTSKHIPDEYLSYHFGWKQTYKDLTDLLALPEKMSKKYSFLIKRDGKPTTFRLKREFVSHLNVGLPAFNYGNTSMEYDVVHERILERTTELRLVINAVFDFPPLNDVRFLSKDYFDRVGLIPRPTDIYNLIPWTWLVDWFTGLGNYVELIDNMSRDTTLVNWGMITGKTTGKLITKRSSKADSVHRSRTDDVPNPDVREVHTLSHTSTLHYECQIRKDAAAALNVKTISGPSLSDYQKSILGALLAQRKAIFTPKS